MKWYLSGALRNLTILFCPSSMNLTDLHNQNMVLTGSSGQLHSLFEQTPTAIAIFKGPEAVFELANKRALEIIGKTKEEVIGRKLVEVLPELKEQGYIDIIKT